MAAGIFFAILLVAYQIAGRQNHRLDLSREKIHSLSPEGREVLKRLSGERITVRAFFADGDPARKEFEMMLREAATHHRRFHFEFLDPDRFPSEAKQSRIENYRTTVIDCGGREERIQGTAEEAVVNALIRLAHPEVRTICFTTGHGELSFSDTERNGISEWKRVLEDQPFQVREIDLGGGDLSECRAVVMAGPHYEMLPKETEALQKIAKDGKGVLLLIDPMDPGEGKSFQAFLKPFGIELGPDVVVDKMSKLVGGDYLIPLVSRYASHPVTARFNAATFLPVARTVNKAKEIRHGVSVTELAFTAPGSWAETDLKKLENGEAEIDPDSDRPGPLPLAAVSEGRKARVAVVGDSDFITNAHLRLAGNKDLALNLLQWLVRDDRWISIRPPETRFEPLFLKQNQSAWVAVFSIGVLPLAALATGSLGIVLRRRANRPPGQPPGTGRPGGQSPLDQPAVPDDRAANRRLTNRRRKSVPQ